MAHYKQQYDRVKRFLDRIKTPSTQQTETDFEDNFWSFFQHCWHLKDWIKNDTSLPTAARENVEAECMKYQSLMVVADLANRSKHYKLKWERHGARLGSKGVNINIPRMDINLSTGEWSVSGESTAEYLYIIITDSDVIYNGLELACEAVTDWDKIIEELGI